MIQNIDKQFILCKKTETLFATKIQKEQLLNSIYTLTQNGFITLVQLSCADWIEDGVFTISYNLTTKERKENLLLQLDINRTDDSLPTLLDIFPQSEIMERDIHEMFGVEFIGNPTLGDFALEDWQEIPPLRREFDTLAYVNEHFEFKKGREDNKDTKAETKRRKAEAKKQKALKQEKENELKEKEVPNA